MPITGHSWSSDAVAPSEPSISLLLSAPAATNSHSKQVVPLGSMAEEETPTQEVVLVQLPAWKAILLRCLFPITVLIFITASVGLYVLTGEWFAL